ncbi:MAG: type II CAAX prenyl endopeptidase Rce1 family protein [Erythrobacter sp.]
MTIGARLADVARFFLRPSYAAQPMPWGRAAALALTILFALDMVIDTLVAWLTDAWDAQAGFLPAPVEEDISVAEDVFSALVLAPVLEELLFRGWLTGRIAALRFAIWGFAALGLFAASLMVATDVAELLGLAGVAVVLMGLVQWSRTRERDTAVPAWFIRHFGWFVWGSTVLFGLIHLGNYEPLESPLGLLVVLPQTIGGLLLAYTRTRLGLGAAIAHHAAYNAIFLAGDYGWW